MYERFFTDQMDHFEKFYDSMKHIKITPNILQKFFTKHLDDVIIDHVDELCAFATGEISVKSMTNMYT